MKIKAINKLIWPIITFVTFCESCSHCKKKVLAFFESAKIYSRFQTAEIPTKSYFHFNMAAQLKFVKMSRLRSSVLPPFLRYFTNNDEESAIKNVRVSRKKKKIGENLERVRLKKKKEERKKEINETMKKIRSCDLRRFPYAYWRPRIIIIYMCNTFL